MNAVSIFRLFTRLFLGERRTGFTVMADALPRERWILAAGVLFVVLGGLFPNVIVVQRSAQVNIVEQALHAPPGLDQLGKVARQSGKYQSLPRPVTENVSAISMITLGVEYWEQ